MGTTELAAAERQYRTATFGNIVIRALGSVSEHVTHHVPSPVLVTRTPRKAEEAR